MTKQISNDTKFEGNFQKEGNKVIATVTSGNQKADVLFLLLRIKWHPRASSTETTLPERLSLLNMEITSKWCQSILNPTTLTERTTLLASIKFSRKNEKNDSNNIFE